MRSESAFIASTLGTTYSENALQAPELDPAFLTESERRAGARAILRHKLHTKGDVATSETNGGLPQLYKELHGNGGAKGKELQKIRLVLKDTFQDLLNAVSTSVVSIFIHSLTGKSRLRH